MIDKLKDFIYYSKQAVKSARSVVQELSPGELWVLTAVLVLILL